MTKNKVASTVEELIAPAIFEQGMELVDVQYIKEGGQWFLRIFIDQPGGIGLEDCQHISRIIDPLLDEKDPIPHSYSLEVSSPGLDRPLKKPADYVRFAGEKIALTTFSPVGNRRRFQGTIIEADQESVTLSVDGETYMIPFEQIASARLVPQL